MASGPAAQTRLAALAKSPRTQGHGDRAVQADLLGAQGQEARRRPRRQGHQPRAVHPRPRRQAAGQAGGEARRRASRSSASRSTRACTAPRSRTAQLAASYPKTIKRRQALAVAAITGKGVGVAVIDTGIAGDAADFKDAAGNSRVIANVVTAPGAATAGDGFGHGTHVAGIIAGNSLNRPAGDPLRGKYIGVAPDANLIAVKASDEAGNSTVLDVINGIAFVVDHKAEFNIRVLNLSVSSDTPQSYKTDPLDAAVEYAWQKGIVVVAASGNRGTAADAVKYAPANDPFVISVGGVDENGNYGRGKRADWSSTGRTQDGFAKPDVDGPGRAHRVRARPEQRVPDPVPELRDRRRLLQGGRHLDGRSGRRRRRGPAPAGPPDAHARPGQGAPDAAPTSRSTARTARA